MAVLCEHNNRFDEGIALAREFLDAHPEAENAVMMHDVLGRQYFHAARYEEALTHLRLMLDDGPELEPALSCLAANYASRAAGELVPDDATEFARLALEIADSMKGGGDEERVIARGELAIAHWCQNDERSFVRSLVEAWEMFLECRAGTNPWKRIGTALAQIAALTARWVTDRELPSKLSKSRPTISRGYFYSATGLEGIWREDFPIIVAFHLCLLSASNGLVESAKACANRVLDAGTPVADGMLPTLQLPLIPFLLLTERADAIERAVETVCSIVLASRRPKSAGGPQVETPDDLVVSLGVVPTAMALGLQAIDDRKRASELAVAAAAQLDALAGDEHAVWREAARMIALAHTEPSAATQLLECAKTAHTNMDGLRLLARLQATVCEDVPLRDAAVVHIQEAPGMTRRAFGGEAQLLVGKWVERYWLTTFERRRFAFSAPGELSREFSQLASLPAETRLRRTLGLVARGLGIGLAPPLAAWCQG